MAVKVLVLFLTRPKSLQSQHVCLFKLGKPLFDKCFQNLRQKIDQKLLKTTFF